MGACPDVRYSKQKHGAVLPSPVRQSSLLQWYQNISLQPGYCFQQRTSKRNRRKHTESKPIIKGQKGLFKVAPRDRSHYVCAAPGTRETFWIQFLKLQTHPTKWQHLILRLKIQFVADVSGTRFGEEEDRGWRTLTKFHHSESHFNWKTIKERKGGEKTWVKIRGHLPLW